MKHFAIGLLALALSAGGLFAAQISGGTQSAGPTGFDYGDGGGDQSIALTFSQFNACSGCTLTGIEFDISGTIVDNYSVTNTNSGTHNFSVITSGTIAIVSDYVPYNPVTMAPATGIYFGETIPTHTKPINGLAGTTCNPTANPGCNVSSGQDTATGSGSAVYDGSGNLTSVSGTAVSSDLTNPIDLTPFLGSGTVTLNILGSFNSTVSGSGNNSSTGGTGAETVTVLYDFTAPEPSTMVLFGSAFIGIGFFARKRVKR